MPIALQNRDEILEHPDRFESIVRREEGRQRQEAAQKRLERQRERIVVRPDEETIVAFGRQVWPVLEPALQNVYTYNTVRAACWAFLDMYNWMKLTSDNSTASLAIRIRLSTRWYDEWSERELPAGDERIRVKRLYQMVHHLAHLMEQNPAGECQWPVSPKAKGDQGW